MRKICVFLGAALAAFALLYPACAAEYRSAFLQTVRGEWSGKGEVVAGRYKGVKFSCKFSAPAAENGAAMNLAGSCRAGIFSQPIKAAISRQGNTLRGSFNEGAQASGLDIIAGTAQKDRLILELNREKLNGHMTARLEGENQLHITLAVKIDEEIIPVIGVDLNRIEPAPATAAAKSGSVFAWLRE